MFTEYLKLRYLENPTEENVLFFIRCLKGEVHTHEANRVRMFSNSFNELLQRVGNGALVDDDVEYDSIDEIFSDLEECAKDIAYVVSENMSQIYFVDDDVIEARNLVDLLKKDEVFPVFDDEGYMSAVEGLDPYNDDLEEPEYFDEGVNPYEWSFLFLYR